MIKSIKYDLSIEKIIEKKKIKFLSSNRDIKYHLLVQIGWSQVLKKIRRKKIEKGTIKIWLYAGDRVES